MASRRAVPPLAITPLTPWLVYEATIRNLAIALPLCRLAPSLQPARTRCRGGMNSWTVGSAERVVAAIAAGRLACGRRLRRNLLRLLARRAPDHVRRVHRRRGGAPGRGSGSG